MTYHFDSKLLEELPLLRSFHEEYNRNPQERTKIFLELMNGRSYEEVFTSARIEDYNAIICLGGVPSHDPKYCEIFYREKNKEEFREFDGLRKISLEGKEFSSFFIYQPGENCYNCKTYQCSFYLETSCNDFDEECKNALKNKVINKNLEDKVINFALFGSKDLKYEGRDINYINRTLRVESDEEYETDAVKTDLYCNSFDELFWKICEKNNSSSKGISLSDISSFSSLKSEKYHTLKSNEAPFIMDSILWIFYTIRRFFDIRFVKNVLFAGKNLSMFLFKRHNILDVFLHSCSQEEAKYIVDNFIFKAGNYVKSVIVSEEYISVNIVICYSDEFDVLQLRFNSKIFPSPSSLAHSFNVDSSSVVYDMFTNSLFCTERFEYAIVNRVNTLLFENYSEEYCDEISFQIHNFGVFIPLFEEMKNNIDFGNTWNRKGINRILNDVLFLKFGKNEMYADKKFGDDISMGTDITMNSTESFNFSMYHRNEKSSKVNVKSFFETYRIVHENNEGEENFIIFPIESQENHMKEFIRKLLKKFPNVVLVGKCAASLFNDAKLPNSVNFFVNHENIKETKNFVKQLIFEDYRIRGCLDYEKNFEYFRHGLRDDIFKTRESLFKENRGRTAIKSKFFTIPKYEKIEAMAMQYDIDSDSEDGDVIIHKIFNEGVINKKTVKKSDKTRKIKRNIKLRPNARTDSDSEEDRPRRNRRRNDSDSDSEEDRQRRDRRRNDSDSDSEEDRQRRNRQRRNDSDSDSDSEEDRRRNDSDSEEDRQRNDSDRDSSESEDEKLKNAKKKGDSDRDSSESEEEKPKKPKKGKKKGGKKKREKKEDDESKNAKKGKKKREKNEDEDYAKYIFFDKNDLVKQTSNDEDSEGEIIFENLDCMKNLIIPFKDCPDDENFGEKTDYFSYIILPNSEEERQKIKLMCKEVENVLLFKNCMKGAQFFNIGFFSTGDNILNIEKLLQSKKFLDFERVCAQGQNLIMRQSDVNRVKNNIHNSSKIFILNKNELKDNGFLTSYSFDV